MATARETIVLALQKTGMQPKGGPSPDSAMIAEGLSALNRLLREIMAGLGMAFIEVYADGSYDVPTDYNALRIMVGGSSAKTITLPDVTSVRVPDGFRLDICDAALNANTYNITIDRNGALINGAASNYTISTAGGGALLMFDAATGNWKLAADKTIDQSIGLPAEYDEGMACWLAVRWSGSRRFGQSLTDYEIGAAKETERLLRARFNKTPRFAFEAAVSNMGGACGAATGGSSSDILSGIDS